MIDVLFHENKILLQIFLGNSIPYQSAFKYKWGEGGGSERSEETGSLRNGLTSTEVSQVQGRRASHKQQNKILIAREDN